MRKCFVMNICGIELKQLNCNLLLISEIKISRACLEINLLTPILVFLY